VSGVFLAADGEPVQADLTQQMIGINAEQMRTIPEVITIAYGTAKIPAAHAALRSGLITGLVTHTTFAHALLEPA
jgi:DNA-binding transcriptional regulator LsrR (DeoR family)